jgi:hypothetical protein
VSPSNSKPESPTSTSTPPPVPGQLELSSSTLDLGAKASGTIQLAVKGSPVTWTATANPGIVVKPGADATVTTELVTITINRTTYPKAGSSTIEFSWATGKVFLTLTWADGT